MKQNQLDRSEISFAKGPILSCADLRVHFPVTKKTGVFSREKIHVKAVDGVTLNLYEGETLGLVGESGCGKSTLGRALIRLYKPTSGEIKLKDTDISTLNVAEMRPFRRDIQMIFQDPYSSLDPRMTVFDILAEPIKTHKLHSNKKDLEKRISELMNLVGLSPRYVKKYPHEFSGGQRQRIAIARALAVDPKIIVCDEPVSALDVSIQAQILNLLGDLQKTLGLSYIFIAHDLGAVKHISHRIAVMYLGKIVEIASPESLFKSPKHPYTQALLSAIPVADPKIERARKRILLQGDLPSPANPPTGCSFHTRCSFATAECKVLSPSLEQFADEDRAVSCLLYNFPKN